MTALRDRKTRLTFETDATIRTWGSTKGKALKLDRPIVVHPNPFYCTLRLKGTKQAYDVPWIVIFENAAELHARGERERRKLARKQKKGAY